MRPEDQLSARDLRGTDIFAGLSDNSLEQIAKFCSQRVCQAGKHCGVRGEAIDELFIVNEGKVAIEMRIAVTPYTHTVTIATLTKGNVCAWSALVPPHVLTASIKCIEETRMIAIKASHLQRIFKEEPLIGCTVMKNLAGTISSRLRESHIQLERLIAEVVKQGR